MYFQSQLLLDSEIIRSQTMGVVHSSKVDPLSDTLRHQGHRRIDCHSRGRILETVSALERYQAATEVHQKKATRVAVRLPLAVFVLVANVPHCGCAARCG